MTYTTEKGSPLPLGISKRAGEVNFSLFSEHATEVRLCLFSLGAETPFFEAPLFQTGFLWHLGVHGLPEEGQIEYGYRVEGPNDPQKRQLYDASKVLLDPYAKEMNTLHIWGKEEYSPRGKVAFPPPFDWENTLPPRIAMENLVIYEMHVRGLTIDPSSLSAHPGMFLGILDKIPHFLKLGINAIELMPIHEFNESESPQKNYWGYSTVNFFSPMNRYAKASALQEFKTMVRELHKHKIEVFLDVVYNHTAEGAPGKGPTYSLRGIDNQVYYLEKDFSGCGNTMNANHPVAARMIIDSLHYWVKEMHVDGFRFDLASALTRDEQGQPLREPPLIEAITYDPTLCDVKLIAEAWDAHGLYQVGSFPAWGRWAEWNGKYRDVVRRFIKGTDGQVGEFARVLCGSEDLYGETRDPYHSINFITAHDGFTLRDLVSYQEKHNEANGEENRDGANNNESWNCGVEGETHNHQIVQLREQQMRNFHAALMISLGIPMILMGDEYGHTRGGNNNTWCQDNALNWFLWKELDRASAFFRFYTLMIAFRHRHAALRRTTFYTLKDIAWHGHEPLQPNWGPESRFIAFSHDNLYIAFNAHFDKAPLHLPHPPPHKKWYRVVDTALKPPEDILEEPALHAPLKHTYNMAPHSAFIAEAY